MLTEVQQGYCVQALSLVEKACYKFWLNYPCLRGFLSPEEMQSAAEYACVLAARTYDPAKSGVAQYFGKAILHELLKACDNEHRSGAVSRLKISLAAAEKSLLSSGKLPGCTQAQRTEAAANALRSMTEEDQRWLDSRFYGEASHRDLAKAEGISPRQVRKRLAQKLHRLKREIEDRLC
jgi:DNA-directed RNA polymerase specialized sigma24 family protein